MLSAGQHTDHWPVARALQLSAELCNLAVCAAPKKDLRLVRTAKSEWRQCSGVSKFVSVVLLDRCESLLHFPFVCVPAAFRGSHLHLLRLLAPRSSPFSPALPSVQKRSVPGACLVQVRSRTWNLSSRQCAKPTCRDAAFSCSCQARAAQRRTKLLPVPVGDSSKACWPFFRPCNILYKVDTAHTMDTLIPSLNR